MAYDEGGTNPATEGAKADTDYYLEAIDRYDRGSETWRTQCEKIIKIYLDQDRGSSASVPRRFALLWSNIETLKPAIYARLPVAVVSRRYKDQDPAGRKASEVMERCINTTFDLYGVDPVMRLVRDDRLLTSRGTAWVRYESEVTDDDQVTSEKVCCEHVHWADFGHSLNRTWPEVTIVWRRVYMTKEKVKKRAFKNLTGKEGEHSISDLNFEVRPEYAQRGGNEIKDACEPQAIIYEIWDKEKKVALWLAKEEKIVLEEGAPPLDFRNFFPCPEPVFGTKATGALIPTPDYRYYQDQAEEINDLTEKIATLTGWLKLKGFYAGGPSSEGSAAVEELLKLEGNQVLVKVESWSGFAEKGGVKGLIEWIPLEVIVVALREAVTTRTQLIQDVYQISGISDILRGETDPNETLGAQEIKAQTGNRRQSPTQRDIARFARDLAEMVGEVVAEVFQPQTMTAMSGLDLTAEPPPELMVQAQQLQAQVKAQPPDPQMQQQAQQALQAIQSQLEPFKLNKAVLELLRDEKTRGFRIEIETDSTIEPDEQAEKQRRIEFLDTVGGFIQKVLPTLQTMPKMAPLAGEMLMFMVRGFRAGRSLEDSIERTVGEMQQQAQQPPPPSPEQQKLEMDKQAMAAKLEQDKQTAALTAQQKDQQHKQALEQSDQQHRQKLEQSEQQFRQKMEQDAITRVADREREDQQKNQDRDFEREKLGRGENAEREKLDRTENLEREKLDRGETLEREKLDRGEVMEREKMSETKGMKREELGLKERQAKNGGKEVVSGDDVRAEKTDKAMKEVAEALKALAKATTAKRAIVRGKDGRASHVETVQ